MSSITLPLLSSSYQLGHRVPTHAPSSVAKDGIQICGDESAVITSGSNNFYLTFRFFGLEANPNTGIFAFRHIIAGRKVDRLSDIMGSTGYFPNQREVTIARLRHYTIAMLEQRWDWENMHASTPEGIVEDLIEIGICPSGKKVILDGHHRIVAATILGREIPESAIKYIHLETEPKFNWQNVDILLYDISNLYPVQAPPFNTSYTLLQPLNPLLKWRM